MILIFDTETNGLPVSHFARYSEVDNWPRIAQLSYGVYKPSGERVGAKTVMIKPDRWTIPDQAFFRDNNMSTERCEREGIPIKEALELFLAAAVPCDTVVAHNLSFDKNVMWAELLRAKLAIPTHLSEYCTKLASEPILKIPGFKGKYKWPTLAEAHQFFLGRGFEGAHDAGADVEACARVYFAIQAHKEMEELF